MLIVGGSHEWVIAVVAVLLGTVFIMLIRKVQ